MQQFPEISVMKSLRQSAILRKARMKSMMLLVIAALRIKSSAEDVVIGPKANPRIRKLALRRCSLKILATLMKLSSHTCKEVSRFKKLSSLLLPLMK